MGIVRLLPAPVLCASLLAGCADDTTTPPTTAAPTTTPPTTAAPTTTPPTTAAPTTTEPPLGGQLAIWPAAGDVIADPAAAARDFISTVFGFAPNLGEFRRGDSRSGEIEVLSPPEGGVTTLESVLLLRQLGPGDGWFVLGAVSDANTIATAEPGSTVTAGPVEVTGQGRGFEGTLIIEARIARSDTVLDRQITQGGAMEAPEPYAVTLDLSAAEPGDTVFIMVQGDVGLENDTGEFSAIPVMIG